MMGESMMVSINYYDVNKTHIISFGNISNRPIAGDYVLINGEIYKVEKVILKYNVNCNNYADELFHVFVSKC